MKNTERMKYGHEEHKFTDTVKSLRESLYHEEQERDEWEREKERWKDKEYTEAAI